MRRRTFVSRFTRGAVLRRYLASEPVPRLNIGVGENPLDGWLNTDVRIYRRKQVVWLDSTLPFPLPDNAFAYLCTEHQFEHIDRAAGERMLTECLRVLRPGGTLRIATPDLAWVGALASATPGPAQKRYIAWMSTQLGLANPDPAAVINMMFRGCGSVPGSGHQFVFSFDALRAAMEAGRVRVGAPLRDAAECACGAARHRAPLARPWVMPRWCGWRR